MWGVYGKVWSRRTRKLSFRLKKNFWHTLKAQKPQKLKIFKKRPKRCILLQNQKVCWLLTYHDSFISTLQIYAQKKEYKRYHSNFYHIDSTLTPHRLSTGLASQITILLALIPLIICEVWGSNQCDKNWSDIFYILFFERIFVMLIWKSRDKLTTNTLFGFVIIYRYIDRYIDRYIETVLPMYFLKLV